MSSNKKINFLKELKQQLISNFKNNSDNDNIKYGVITKYTKEELEKIITDFYKKSSRISNAVDGMIFVITENGEYVKYAKGGTSHKRILQKFIDENLDYPFDLNSVNADFGKIMPEQYNSIFIRMSSILNGSSIIYYPDSCNEYQKNQLKLFLEIVKKYNENTKDKIQIESNEYNYTSSSLKKR